jgi:enolase
MSVIEKLEAKEILDSRGNPTVSVVCILKNNMEGMASVPSGASTGAHEACELRDVDGKGVQKAIKNVTEEISRYLLGKELDQEALDESLIKLDGTNNKSRLGANAILAVSLAFASACANEKKVQLYQHLADLYFENNIERAYKIPQPAFNVINGGKHSNSGLSFQEFMLVPTEFETIKIKVEVAKSITESLKELLTKDGESTTMGDEGGFAPKLSSNESALEYLETAISVSGYNTHQVKLGIDVAATTFYKEDCYVLEGKKADSAEIINVYSNLCDHHKIISIEDGLYEEDFTGFAEMTRVLGDKINIVGDDLTVTNVRLIKKAIKNQSINTVLIKPNQIGTLSETFEAIKLAQENNLKIFVSHRSGETGDTFIADLAVAVGADFIKAGAPTKKERIAKYERLIEIESQLLF